MACRPICGDLHKLELREDVLSLSLAAPLHMLRASHRGGCGACAAQHAERARGRNQTRVCAACKEIKVIEPLKASGGHPSTPSSICGTVNSTMDTIRGADVRLLHTCLQEPTPQCYLQAQQILLRTGCLDCLPYLQEHDARDVAYCREHESKQDCEAALAPCQRQSLIRAPPLLGPPPAPAHHKAAVSLGKVVTHGAR